MRAADASPAFAAEATDVPPALPACTVELCLAPDDVAALVRLNLLERAGPSRAATLLWYDDAERSLAQDGKGLLRDGGSWQLLALETDGGADWPACSPAPLLDAADALAPLSPPFDVAPVAAFEGRRRAYRADALGCEVLHGTLRGVVGGHGACRVRLSGLAHRIEEVAAALTRLRVAVPRGSLAAEALAAARQQPLPARHLGGPSVAGGTAVSDGLASIASHLVDVLLYWVDQYRIDGREEAVHQARVATRRLRSALTLYKRAAPSPALAEAALGLKGCAELLGGARDWDVFLGGTGRILAGSGSEGGDRRLDALLRAAGRQRAVAHAALAAYLASAEFRGLEVRLGLAASLRPWERTGDAARLQAPTAVYAGEVLARRYRRVRRRGRALDGLAVAELHELRKDCKRLRYAAEFFTPAFPGKAGRVFVRRLAALQEALGALNDSAVAAGLMAQLGRAGRGYAGGVVTGYAEAAVGPARKRIAERWLRFRRAEPFWGG